MPTGFLASKTTENKYIGWLEKEDKGLFYINYLQTPNLKHSTIVAAQKETTFKILDSLSKSDFHS